MTELSEKARAEIDGLIATCESPREALLLALEIVQRDCGYVDDTVAEHVATRLRVNRADVDDVLSFYTVYDTAPVGRYVIRICRTLPCALVGAESLAEHLSATLGIAVGETTADGLFTLKEAECLGLCDVAPAMTVNEHVYGSLTPDRIDRIIADLRGV